MTTFWLWSSTPIPLNILRTHSVFPSAHVQLTVYHIWFHYKAAEQQTYIAFLIFYPRNFFEMINSVKYCILYSDEKNQTYTEPKSCITKYEISNTKLSIIEKENIERRRILNVCNI